MIGCDKGLPQRNREGEEVREGSRMNGIFKWVYLKHSEASEVEQVGFSRENQYRALVVMMCRGFAFLLWRVKV